MSSHAYRNLKLCTKDCLCLFVCPTGATDNETGQIDFSKCIGCGACAKACPSHAITMITLCLKFNLSLKKWLMNYLKLLITKLKKFKY